MIAKPTWLLTNMRDARDLKHHMLKTIRKRQQKENFRPYRTDPATGRVRGTKDLTHSAEHTAKFCSAVFYLMGCRLPAHGLAQVALPGSMLVW